MLCFVLEAAKHKFSNRFLLPKIVCLKYRQLDESLLEGEREVSPATPTALASALASGEVDPRVSTKKTPTPLFPPRSTNLKAVDISCDLIIRTRFFAEEGPRQKVRFQG